MKYYELQDWVESELNKKHLSLKIPSWINEVREDISRKLPLKFLLKSKSITPVASTYSYAFDKNETTDRYGGFYDNVNYYDGTKNKSLLYANSECFGILYPIQSAGNPSSYTVRGVNFTVDKIPATISSQTLTGWFYALPNTLEEDYDEEYIDKKYYGLVVSFVMVKALIHTADQPESLARWQGLAIDYLVDMLSQESVTPVSRETAMIKFGLVPNKKDEET